MTKNYILTLDNDFNQMNAGHIYLNGGKMKSFYQKYEGLIRIFKREARDIQNEYFVVENDVFKTEGEGADKKFVMQEGKTLEQYKEAYTKWGNKEV